LRKQAEERKTSLNTLVNQIFSKYAEWDAFAEKYGFVNFPHDFYMGIADSTEEEQLRQNARIAGRHLRDYLLFMFKRADPETFLTALKLAGRYSGMGSFEIEQGRSHCKVVVHHNLGRKHSLFVGAALEEAVISILGVRPKAEVTDVSVILEFETVPALEMLPNSDMRSSLIQNTA
jgi:hypothetical protein